MLVSLYFICFLASLGLLLGLLMAHRRIITSVVMLSILVTVSSFGRFLISVSTTMELANLGNILLNVGACYCPLVLISILAHFCNLKLSLAFWIPIVIFATAVYILPFPFPGMDLYYRSLSLGKEYGATVLLREFGPLQVLYPTMLVIYMGICVGLLIIAIRRHKKANISTVIVSVALVLAIMLVYLLDRITNNPVNYSIHCYFLAMIILLWRMERANMYDLSTNISASIEALNENGYIQFDRAYRCTGVNDRIREIFPEIDQKWRLGRKIPQYDSFLYREVVQWIYNRQKDEKKIIEVDGAYYALIVRDIPYMRWKCVGYLLALVDRTSEITYMKATENYKENLEQEVQKKTEKINCMKDSLVLGMASMVESRDDCTGNHIKRTYSVMQVFAEKLRLHKQELHVTDEFLDMVTRAAPMHDLGKIAIDDSVLKKQGIFTAQDFDRMKVHPQEGARIVREILTGVEDPAFVEIAANVAHYHHEKWDGTGYPAGLAGEEIPLEARIMALPDVFDALASKRRYKDALPFDVVFPMIQGNKGSHFDPVLCELFLECRPQLEEMYDRWYQEDTQSDPLNLTRLVSSR